MLTRERLGGGPIAAATESDGGTLDFGGSVGAAVGAVLAAPVVRSGSDRFVSSSTPSGASAPSDPLEDDVSAPGGLSAVATDSESGSAPGPMPVASESRNAVGLSGATLGAAGA